MIYIDTREPILLRDQVEKLAETQFIPTALVTLTYGDFRWESLLGRVCVERKAISDLLNTFSSGRAFEQFSGLIEDADLPILMLEGKFTHHGNRVGSWSTKDDNTKWDYSWETTALDHLLLSWQLAGIYIIHSWSPAKTAHRLLDLYQYTQKETHELGQTRKKRLPLTPLDGEDVRILAGFPGIGVKTARRLHAKGFCPTIRSPLTFDSEAEKLKAKVRRFANV